LLKNYNAKLMSYRLEDSNEIFEGTDSVFDNQSIKHFLKILQNVGFTNYPWPCKIPTACDHRNVNSVNLP
jgi:hypothetical protein